MPQSLSKIVSERETLIAQIEEKVQDLKKDFQDNPLKIEVRPIQELMTHLVALNESLKTRQSSQISRLGGRTAKILLAGSLLATALALSLSLAGIFTKKENEKESEDNSLSRDLQIAAAVTLVAAGIFEFCYSMRRESDAEIAQLAEFESSNERNFQKFLDALNEFKQSTPEDQALKLCRCIHAYEWIQDKYHFSPKEEFIPKMILSLQPTDPLRLMMEELIQSSMDSEDDRFQGEQETLDHTLHRKPDRQFQITWKKLEQSLGAELTTLKIGSIVLSKKIESPPSYASDDSDD